MKPPEVSELLQALKDASVYQRQKAARTLGRIDPATVGDLPTVTTALEAVSADPNKYVRMAAGGALLRLAGDNSRAKEVFGKLLSDEHRDVRAGALAALGELGIAARVLVPDVQDALNDPEESVRQQATLALEKIKP